MTDDKKIISIEDHCLSQKTEWVLDAYFKSKQEWKQDVKKNPFPYLNRVYELLFQIMIFKNQTEKEIEKEVSENLQNSTVTATRKELEELLALRRFKEEVTKLIEANYKMIKTNDENKE